MRLTIWLLRAALLAVTCILALALARPTGPVVLAWTLAGAAAVTLGICWLVERGGKK